MNAISFSLSLRILVILFFLSFLPTQTLFLQVTLYSVFVVVLVYLLLSPMLEALLSCLVILDSLITYERGTMSVMSQQ